MFTISVANAASSAETMELYSIVRLMLIVVPPAPRLNSLAASSAPCDLSAARQKRHKIDPLPRDLAEAVSLMEKSALVRETLGEHIFAKFVENKRQEIEDYRKNVGAEFDKQVSEYEVKRFLPFL